MKKSAIKLFLELCVKGLKGLLRYIKQLTRYKVYYLEGELTHELILEILEKARPPHFFATVGTESCACKRGPTGKSKLIKSGVEATKAKWVLLD